MTNLHPQVTSKFIAIINSECYLVTLAHVYLMCQKNIHLFILQAVSDPANTLSDLRRFLGRKFTDLSAEEIQRYQKHFLLLHNILSVFNYFISVYCIYFYLHFVVPSELEKKNTLTTAHHLKVGSIFLMRYTQKGYCCRTPYKWCFVSHSKYFAISDFMVY